MFVGHLGAAMMLKRAEPRLNLGALFFAAMWCDLLLWVLAWAGVERVIVPADYATSRFFTFDFPFSHGLAASLMWSLLAGLAGWAALGENSSVRQRAAAALSVAVFSHFPLDVAVHVPEIPIFGNDSMRLGLGLWKNMPVALTVELLLAAIGLVIFLRGSPMRRSRAAWTAIFIAALAVMTAAGPYFSPVPKDPMQVVVPSMISIVAVVLVGCWIDGRIGLTAARPFALRNRPIVKEQRVKRRGMARQ